jgi:hypothetical protein
MKSESNLIVRKCLVIFKLESISGANSLLSGKLMRVCSSSKSAAKFLMDSVLVHIVLQYGSWVDDRTCRRIHQLVFREERICMANPNRHLQRRFRLTASKSYENNLQPTITMAYALSRKNRPCTMCHICVIKRGNG